MTENGLQRFSGWRAPSFLPVVLDDCSLVVATYKRPQELLLLLEALVKVPDPPGEVVIVDGSPEGNVEREVQGWTTRQQLPFDLLYVRSPAGLTRQRNVGIDISSKEFVYFMDDDCIPLPGYFRELRQVFVNDKECSIGAACGLLVNEMDRPVSLRWRLRLALRLVPRIQPGIYHPSGTSVPRSLIKPFSGVRSVDMLSGCSMVFRRQVLDRHRFSEFFYGYSQGEDLEMSLRIGSEWQIVWCGDARANHNHASGGRPTPFRKGLMEVRNRHFIWRRHATELKLTDSLRFWLDMGFLILMDLASFVVQPRDFLYSVSHAWGVAWGVLTSIFAPPRYEEPPARPQYVVAFGATARD